VVDPAKIEAVEELREKFGKARAAIFSDFRGLTVAEINELRNRLKAEGIEFRVIKNTLARRAVAETPMAPATTFMEGPTSVALCYDDEASTAAKILAAYAKEQEVFELKGGVLESRILDVKDLQRLAELPPREVLQAQLLSALQGPQVQLLGVLQGVLRSFLGTLQAFAEAKSSHQHQ
jgi:large subunit ribosomal protein L10